MILSEVKLNNSKYRPQLNGKPIKTQRINIKCDECGKEYDSSYIYWKKAHNKYSKDLCRSCKMRIEYSNGERESKGWDWFNTGETLEQKLGKEKALKYRKLRSQLLSGKNNPNYGGKYSRGFAENYLSHKGKTYKELYGQEKAEQMKENLSKKFSGSGNNMYGKPSPKGSGNGWSGWYKGWYFRSLIELSYMINVIEKNNYTWIDAESKKYKIPYIIDNVKKNYFGDFIINNKYFIEIKPRNLRNSEDVLLKEEAGIIWCKEHNLEYKIICDDEFNKLTGDEIDKLVFDGIIKFIDRYQRKYDDRKKI